MYLHHIMQGLYINYMEMELFRILKDTLLHTNPNIAELHIDIKTENCGSLYPPYISTMAFSNNQNNSKSDHLISSNLKTPAETLSSTALYIIKAFAYCRIILGAGSLLFPHFTCGLF